GNPFSFAIVRVFAVGIEKEIMQKVADKIGRYYALVPNGEYYVTIEKKNLDESYTKIYTSSAIIVKKGLINQNMAIKQSDAPSSADPSDMMEHADPNNTHI